MRKVIILLAMTLAFSTVAYSQNHVLARAGETVKTIAERIGVNAVDLAKYNGLLPDSTLREGYRITVPPGTICPLTIDRAPVIRGLKLGMIEKDAEAFLGELRFTPNFETMTRSTSVFVTDKDGFENVRFISLQTFDSKIYRIDVSYRTGVQWHSLGEVIENFAPKLGLPDKLWNKDLFGYRATMPCKGFEVEINTHIDVDVVLTDMKVVEQIAKESKASEQYRKKAIKP